MRALRSLAPGLSLCGAISLASLLGQRAEQEVLGRAYLEALVLAILIGVAARTLWRPSSRWTAGIRFSGHTVLEIAVMLLGASISFQAIGAAGPLLLCGIAAVVCMSIIASYATSRALDLSPRLSMLVACGNSICGNSAIAAVAPVIGADGGEVASSIAFTAILGVATVLILPFLISPLGLSHSQYGIFAGMTVYSVPQVLAATLPVATLSVQIGTIVKLVRVMMLGPVVAALSFVSANRAPAALGGAEAPQPRRKFPTHRIAPWFIIGFLLLAALRSIGFLPSFAAAPAVEIANLLTIVAMAALGLAVDLRELSRVGLRVTAAVTGSLLVLGLISFAFIRLLAVA